MQPLREFYRRSAERQEVPTGPLVPVPAPFLTNQCISLFQQNLSSPLADNFNLLFSDNGTAYTYRYQPIYYIDCNELFGFFDYRYLPVKNLIALKRLRYRYICSPITITFKFSDSGSWHVFQNRYIRLTITLPIKISDIGTAHVLQIRYICSFKNLTFKISDSGPAHESRIRYISLTITLPIKISDIGTAHVFQIRYICSYITLTFKISDSGPVRSGFLGYVELSL
jgi:hypothetical protein